jgi:hypothetical protein
MHSERVVEVLLVDYRSESHFVADSAVALFSALVDNEGTRCLPRIFSCTSPR